MGLKLISPPATYPISVADIKQQLKVDFTDDDDMIEALLKGAIAFCEKSTGRALIDQTWDYYVDAFPVGAIYIPRPPLIEVVGVFYTDAAGAEQEFAAASYLVDSASIKARVSLAYSAAWPSVQSVANAVRIRFRAGYLNTDSPPVANVPDDIITAIILRMKADYDDAPSADKLRSTADILLAHHRVLTGLA